MKLQKLGPVGPSGFLECGGSPPLLREGVAAKLESSSFEFGFQQLLLVLRGPLPFVGDHARGGRRNSDFRAARRASLPLSISSALLHGA